MKINNTNIEEYNIAEYIEERIDKDFVKIFKELKEDVKAKVKTEKYSSLSSNYVPIFLYHVMNKGIDTNKLSIILNLSDNYEKGLNRFFEPSDVSFDGKRSLWDNIHYFFYKKENNKVVMDSDKIKYVEEFCVNVRKKNLLDFHSSRIDFFITKYLYRNEEYTDRFSQMVQNNKLLLESETLKYNSLPNAIIRNIADSSYDTDVKKIYDKFKNNEFLYKLIKEALINVNYNGQYKNHLSTVEMVSKNDDNFFQIYHERLLNIKEELKSLQMSNMTRNDYIEIIKDCKFSMIDMLKEKNLVLDINDIDLNEPIMTNVPFLFFIEGVIENQKFNHVKNINIDFINYVKENKEELLGGSEPQVMFSSSFITKKRLDTVLSFLEYKELNINLEEKTNKEKKIKI